MNEKRQIVIDKECEQASPYVSFHHENIKNILNFLFMPEYMHKRWAN